MNSILRSFILPHLPCRHTVLQRSFWSRLSLGLLAALLLAGLAHSPAWAAAKMQANDTCLELAVNGGFEQIGEGWHAIEGASLFTYAPDYFVGGERSLQLGFTAPNNIPATFAAQQRIDLPTQSTRIELSFYSIATIEGVASPSDQAYLTIQDVESGELLSKVPLFPAPTASSTLTVGQSEWTIGRYDLTPIAGKSINLAFVVEDDGEPGRLVLRVDEVSVFACVPPEIYALLVQPTPPPVTQPAAASPVLTNQAVFTQTTLINSLDACDCSAKVHQCSDFASWSIAQACFMQCQVTAGYDIHALDVDGNGIACELELQDVPSLDVAPSLQEPLTDTLVITSTLVTATLVTSVPVISAAGELSVTPESGVVTWNAIASATVTPTSTPIATLAVSLPSSTEPVTSVVTSVVNSTATPMADSISGGTSPSTAAPTSSPTSPTETLMQLLLSPLGYLIMGALLMLGALGLFGAYVIGQRSQSQTTFDKELSAQANPEDFTLQADDEPQPPKK